MEDEILTDDRTLMHAIEAILFASGESVALPIWPRP